MAALTLVPEQAEPFADWLEPSLQDTAGRDPLGLNTITLDRVLPQLIPGILQLSERARYFSIYPWMLWLFAERKRPATSEELDDFIRRREFELCLAMKLCPHCSAYKAIGGSNAAPRVTAGEDPFARGLSVASTKGGFGLYYRSPLIGLGAVAPVGTPLGREETPTPIEVLLKNDRAVALALAFHDSIKDTEYFERFERTSDPIPRQVLEALAERVCLCRLPHLPGERDAIRELMFSPVDEEAAEACEARRRAFALYLWLLDRDRGVAEDDGLFWQGVISKFLLAPTADDIEGRTFAPWAALAMKECVQDALCSIWTGFCRAGVEQQDHDGMTNEELVAMIRSLAHSDDLELGAVRLSISPEESALAVQSRLAAVSRSLDWNDVRAWAANADSAIAGLVGLLLFADRLPDPGAVHPFWREIAGRRSEHQDGLLGALSLLRHRLRTEPTVAELLDWTVRRFLIGPHEAIAYSKLPKATFRFAWQETGRLRFFTPGGGGLERFAPSDDRRETMALLSEDLGLWESDDEDAPALTDDGRTFVAEVFEP
jgi:hypothetical protein